MKNILIGIVVVGLLLVVSYLIVAGVVFGICWAFGLVFTHKMVIGVYLVLVLLNMVFGR